MSNFGKGVFFAVSAYLVWGFLPIYWRLLSAINPIHILGFRIIFSLLSVGLVLLIAGNRSWLKFYKNKKTRTGMIIASILVTFNWGLYIWAVTGGYTIEAALGYYINPLFSIAMGIIILKEKLRLMQIVSFSLAFIGVLILTILTGRLPWISLCLAITFAIYGFIKKTVNLSALESLGVETLLASPIGLFLLFIVFEGGQNVQNYITVLPISTIVILILSGVATSLPLYLFAKGARMLPLSTMGFIQFISPTLTFLTGLLIFRESFPVQNFIAFGFIWAAAIIYIASLKRVR
ncbi:MAG: EamA family transporter RarD [Treponema sp.]|nr:EamA family transporter RarD [Treponema sp.]